MNDIIFRAQRKEDVAVWGCAGNDLTVFQAARVSRCGEDEAPCEERLTSFIEKLMADGHMVPFEHCNMTFFIIAPIFVFRQLFRYRTATISEMSMRYREAKPEFYIPKNLADVYATDAMMDSYLYSWEIYQALLEKGVSRETARSVLPVGTFSQCLFTLNLRNMFHIFDQRIDEHAQAETRFVAERMFELAKEMFPIAVSAWAKNAKNNMVSMQ